MSDDAPLDELDAGTDPGPGLPGFDAPQPAQDSGYQVLARKYRPQNFADLIGQEPMVRTLKNAFAAGRIAHAYMLTGVRGIGKTTTARLIARALNYETDNVGGPSIDPDTPGVHCDAIARSSHVDVMEMDAASRTGVGDIREILDGVRYSPVSARYKVYIIDEVHMLSTSAFNALLKTLEEPPEHVKFIFATTEIRKVPVTVLSRCQRFDLKRIDRDVLTDHLASVCEKEGASVEREGLTAIARAAEGSVRDALSLLDQAIVQASDDGPVGYDQIREMLGLADRTRVLDLLEAVLKHEAKPALDELRHQYDSGADPQVLMRDVLDYLHALTRIKSVGDEADLGEAKETTERLAALASGFSLASLARLWKLTLSGFEDVRSAPDPVSAAEMAMIRLMAAASLPGPEEAARLLAGAPAPAAPEPAKASDAPRNEGPPPTEPTDYGGGHDQGSKPEGSVIAGPETIDAFLKVVEDSRDINLKLDIERFVRPVSIAPGKFMYESASGAPATLGGRISRFLTDLTGSRWLVDATAKGGGETVAETRKREREEKTAAVMRDPVMMKVLTSFPGAELIKVEDPPEDTQLSADDHRREETQG
jgi:DNA polymerase-3 subunit gamma/tau